MNIKIFLHKYLTPRHALTKLVGKLASAKLGKLTTGMINIFAKANKINLDEAKYPPSHYQTFNEFFIRELKDGARTLGTSDVVSPADGKLAAYGTIEQGQLVQAKGQDYTVRELLAISSEEAAQFNGGSYFTVYLSPRDYHRVHMPVGGKLVKAIFVPGDLYSVNDNAIANIEALYARNERMICYFETEMGLMAHVLVGATITGSIHTVWPGAIEAKHSKRIIEVDYHDQDIYLEKGAYMGAFLMGSTTVTLFTENLTFKPDTLVGQPMQVLQDLANKPGNPFPQPEINVKVIQSQSLVFPQTQADTLETNISENNTSETNTSDTNS